MRIEGRTFLVTGGASGLGEGVTRELVARGAHVVVLDLDDEKGPKLAEELGKNVLYVKTDITDEISTQHAIEQGLAKYGKLNGVINCAGVASARKMIDKNAGVHALGLFEKVIQINLTGTFNVCRLGAAVMASQDPDEGERGVIINTASVAAFEGQQGQVAYSASKGGVVGMTVPMARELAPHHIRVCAIAPGVFDTPMMQMLPDKARHSILKTIPFPKRFGTAQDFANLCLSIIENSMLNGEVIRLDGGLRLAML